MSEYGQPDFRFKNEHLSVSRLKLLEQCKHAFFRRYVNKGSVESAPRGDAADFGIVLHAALEMLYRWIISEEYEGLFPIVQLLECYRLAFTDSKLTGVKLYDDGVNILREYARRMGTVDHMMILDVEREFNIDIGGFLTNGFIDRIDKVDDETVKIIDYKSNREPFSKDEMDNDLQVSLYGCVGRVLYPWAKRFVFDFEMLRHGYPQRAFRSAEQIDDHMNYIAALGKRSETEEERAREEKREPWQPTINTNCSYCDYRRGCSAYKKLLDGRHEVARIGDLEDVNGVATEYEERHKVAKAAYARKAELQDTLKARVVKLGEFEAAGHRYRTIPQAYAVYEVEDVVRVFSKIAGLDREQIMKRVLEVEPSKVEELRVDILRSLGTSEEDRTKAFALKDELERIAKKRAGTPKFDSRPLAKQRKA